MTEETLGSFLQLLKQKNVKKNYQDILIQYLNSLKNSNLIIDNVAKNIKNAFFNCVNDLVLNKSDELKYIIIYLDEKYKKKKKEKYFNIWKNTTLGASNNNIKKNEIEITNNDTIYRNKGIKNIFDINKQKHFSIEENIKQKNYDTENLLKEMKKYIIDYDDDMINKEKDNNLENIILIKDLNKNDILEEEKLNIEKNIDFNMKSSASRNNNNYINSDSSNKKNKRAKTDDDSEKIQKYRKKFKELEEEYRIKYLLSSKSYINDSEAQNIINIKESINKAVNNTRNNINKIDEYEYSKKINESNKKLNKNKQNEDIQVMIFDSLEKIEPNINNFDPNLNNKKDSIKNKYFINNDLKIEKVNTKVINNFNIKLENYSQKGNRNSNDRLYLVSNVNEFSFAPKSSSHNNDKNNNINKKINNDINENKKLEHISSLKDLNESSESNNNIDILKKLNNIMFEERLINEEMIQKFLKNKKNEGIFQDYKSKNSSSNKTINSYNYKNKYLGYTLGGIKRKRQVNSSSNILKSDHSFNINLNKSEEEIINKSNITTLKKDNSNFLTINKINNMLEEMFNEENNKKLRINISQTENNSINMNHKNKKKNVFHKQKNNNAVKQIKKNYIPNKINEYTNFNKPKYKINRDKLYEKNPNKNQKPKKFKVNIKGNDKKYILNTINNTENNSSKNSLNKIPNNNLLELNIPLSTMTFDERLEFFKNKKGSDIQKIKSTLLNKESNIYTFYPKTNKVSFEKRNKSYSKVINYENSKENCKTKINYDYLNGLYLDYKKRNLRLKKLREENDKEDGISFNPFLYKNRRWDNSEKKSI